MAQINWDDLDPIDERRVTAIEEAFTALAGDTPTVTGTPRMLAELAVAALNELLETELEVRAWSDARDEMSDEEFRRIALMVVGVRLEAILRDEAADEMRAHHADAMNVMRSHKDKRETIAHIVHSERASVFKEAETLLRSRRKP